jgi:hypothetical protein
LAEEEASNCRRSPLTALLLIWRPTPAVPRAREKREKRGREKWAYKPDAVKLGANLQVNRLGTRNLRSIAAAGAHCMLGVPRVLQQLLEICCKSLSWEGKEVEGEEVERTV